MFVHHVPQGAPMWYDKDPQFDAYKISERGGAIIREIYGERVTVDPFPIAVLVRVPVLEVAVRRFDILDREQVRARAEMAEVEDSEIFRVIDAAAVTNNMTVSGSAATGVTKANLADAYSLIEDYDAPVANVVMRARNYRHIRSTWTQTDFDPVTRRELLKTGYMGKEIAPSGCEAASKLDCCGKLLNKNRTIRSVEETMFDITPSIAYVIGVYLGDGWSDGKRLCLRVCDKDFAQYFCDIVNKTFCRNLHVYVEKHATEKTSCVYGVELHHVVFCSWLEKVTNHKRRIPRAILEGNNEIIQGFLTGFFDSEGSVMSTGCGSYNVRIQCVSRWMKQIEQLFNKIKIRTSGFRTFLTRCGTTCYSFDIYIKDLYDFPISIRCKRDRVLWHRDNINPLHSETVRRVSHKLGSEIMRQSDLASNSKSVAEMSTPICIKQISNKNGSLGFSSKNFKASYAEPNRGYSGPRIFRSNQRSYRSGSDGSSKS
jgi:hypothetical protein